MEVSSYLLQFSSDVLPLVFASKLFGQIFYSLLMYPHSVLDVVLKYDCLRCPLPLLVIRSLLLLQKMAKRSSVQAKHTISESDKAGDRKNITSHAPSDPQKVGYSVLLHDRLCIFLYKE